MIKLHFTSKDQGGCADLQKLSQISSNVTVQDPPLGSRIKEVELCQLVQGTLSPVVMWDVISKLCIGLVVEDVS